MNSIHYTNLLTCSSKSGHRFITWISKLRMQVFGSILNFSIHPSNQSWSNGKLKKRQSLWREKWYQVTRWNDLCITGSVVRRVKYSQFNEQEREKGSFIKKKEPTISNVTNFHFNYFPKSEYGWTSSIRIVSENLILWICSVHMKNELKVLKPRS